MELSGKISVLFDDAKLASFCAAHIPGFDPHSYKVVAVRLYHGLENILTVYARPLADRSGKALPVKKFKVEATAEKLLAASVGFNLTVSDAAVDLADMEVINR